MDASLQDYVRAVVNMGLFHLLMHLCIYVVLSLFCFLVVGCSRHCIAVCRRRRYNGDSMCRPERFKPSGGHDEGEEK